MRWKEPIPTLDSTQSVHAQATTWIPGLALVFSWLFAQWARGAAYEWGIMVKSAVDLYLPDLSQKLGYKLPENHSERREFWNIILKI